MLVKLVVLLVAVMATCETSAGKLYAILSSTN